MEKYFELYDDDTFEEELDKAYKFTIPFCDNCEECIGCPFQYVKGDCIGSLLGEAWRRLKNKNL